MQLAIQLTIKLATQLDIQLAIQLAGCAAAALGELTTRLLASPAAWVEELLSTLALSLAGRHAHIYIYIYMAPHPCAVRCHGSPHRPASFGGAWSPGPAPLSTPSRSQRGPAPLSTRLTRGGFDAAAKAAATSPTRHSTSYHPQVGRGRDAPLAAASLQRTVLLA